MRHIFGFDISPNLCHDTGVNSPYRYQEKHVRRKHDDYPERFPPYYTPGIGWTEDTRYLEKFGGCLGSWFTIFLIIAVIYTVMDFLFGV